ncbi:MAG: polysaccharide deacetylase family protein [Vicinamibacteria bacterium]
MKSAGATVLMYHRLSDWAVFEDEALYTVPPASFEEHMKAIVELGHPVLRAEELASRKALEGAVAITFDDGCSSDCQVALPILRSLGLTAAFFVNPGRVGEKHFMSWDQIAFLASEGMSIGSHGLDHRLFDGLPLAEIERQLFESRSLLEKHLGLEVTLLSLPGGSGARTAPAIARRLGYRVVFGSDPAPVRGDEEIVPRFAIRRRETVAGLQELLRGRPLRLARERVRNRALRTARAVGGPLYERVRELWFSRAAESSRTERR